MTSIRPETAVGRGFRTLGTGEAFARIIGFAATLYVARTLGPSVYGTLVVATTVMVYAGRVVDGGVDLLGVHDVAHDRARLAQLVPAYVGARLLVSAVLIVLLVVAGLLFLQPEGAILAAFAFALGPLAMGTRWAHIGLEKPGIVSIARIATEVIGAVLIIALVRNHGDVGRVPVALIIGEAIGAFILLRALPTIVTSTRALAQLDVVPALFVRSWPIVVSALLGLVTFNSDSFFLRVFWDSATVGFYAAAYSVVSFFVNLGQSYSLSLLPVMTRVRDDPEPRRILYHSATATIFAGVFPIALGGILVADRLIPALQGDAYLPAVLPLQILLAGMPIALMRNAGQAVLIAHGRQGQMLKATAIAAVCNLVLNLALIPVWQMKGAAVATVVTEVVRSIVLVTFIRSIGIPMTPPRRFWRTVVAGVAMGGAVVLLSGVNVWLAVMAGGLVYVLTLFAVGGVRLHRERLPELMV